MSQVTSPPGSDAAVKAGCTCPVLDNGRGRGMWSKPGEPVFWISGDCPMHAPSPPAALEEKP